MTVPLIDRMHEDFVYERRTRVLSEMLVRGIPSASRVLDVGCGDGLIAQRMQALRPDLSIDGVDVLVRPRARIPVREFDGKTLPYSDDSFDVVLLVDVLHHAEEPAALLGETVRVSRGEVILKDHLRKGPLARAILTFMDRVGNARHGVSLPGNYWSEQEWRRAFSTLNVSVTSWSTRVPLYPRWASWLFGRSLHFVARISKTRG